VYYITRVLIPPLERIFNLVGADIRSWYEEMPKPGKVDHLDSIMLSPKKGPDDKENIDNANIDRFKIDEHFRSNQCFTCGSLASEGNSTL
jgi:DNA polymerase zeta